MDKPKPILTSTLLMTILSWAACGLVIAKLDPYIDTGPALGLFFFSAFLGLTGTFTLVLFYMKQWRIAGVHPGKHLEVSLRQGFLLGLSTILCLGLLMLGLLRIWNSLLIVLLITLIEFYFSGGEELR